jgi:hypothetical protein
MSLERDLQADSAVIELEDIVLSEAGTVYSTTIIDTQWFRNFMVIVKPSREIDEDTAVDDLRIVFRDSPDAVTYTAVSQGKVLPTRNYDANGQLCFNAIAPYEQTFGLTSVERYIEVGILGTVVDSAITFEVLVVMQPEQKDFQDYDPGVVTDGLP